ncbi:MAG: GTPase Era [Betaproteobacteria bacterium]|nr:MAG: GTPase Era [Betaproteobacteria bacterium]TMH89495.1 MAG: GTPase Era [Betaproteobacteria bacterium]
MAAEPYRCGAIALIGRPNVGKSTLLNALLGQKLSITSRKPQTTRQSLRGVLTTETAQFVLVDTPGFQTRHRGALNRAMNRAIRGVLEAIDIVVLVVEAKRFGAEDRVLLKLVPAGVPLFLVVNKIDTAEAADLLPFLEKAASEAEFEEIVPVSASRGRGLAELLGALKRHLPEQPAIHSVDALTDSNERFLAAEFLREKLFRLLGEELPYSAGVEIEKFEEQGGMRRIHAAIVVGKEGHKAIIIGSGGSKLKEIATAARLDMERLFGGKVYLQVWVKVRSGWTDDEAALRRMGYG